MQLHRDTRLAESLRDQLGSESAGRWIEFMDLMRASLPFLLRGAGRPTADEITSSAIGSGGFTSWREMVETPASDGGLGWSYDTYKSWKKAYSVVLEHPYVRDLGLSASQINTLKRENRTFPATLEDYKALTEKRKDSLEERRSNSVKGLQAQLSTAKQEAAATRQALDLSRASEAQLKSDQAQLRQELAQTSERNGALQVQVETLTKTVKTQENRIQELVEADETNSSVRVAHSIFMKYVQRIWSFSRWDFFKIFIAGQMPRPQEVSKALRDKASTTSKTRKNTKSRRSEVPKERHG